MRKSTITTSTITRSAVTKSAVAALALVAALGIAAQVRAEEGGKDTKTEAKTDAKTDTKTEAKTATANTATKAAKPTHHHARAQSGHRVAGPVAAPAQIFRIPANPVMRDCVHVAFPQCGPKAGLNPLNDGDFPLHE